MLDKVIREYYYVFEDNPIDKRNTRGGKREYFFPVFSRRGCSQSELWSAPPGVLPLTSLPTCLHSVLRATHSAHQASGRFST